MGLGLVGCGLGLGLVSFGLGLVGCGLVNIPGYTTLIMCDSCSLTGRSKWHSVVSCSASLGWFSAFHKATWLVPYCSCSTRQSCKDNGMKTHSYDDHKHVHVSTVAADVGTAVQRFVSCTERIESWTISNRLRMNAERNTVDMDGIQKTACQSRH